MIQTLISIDDIAQLSGFDGNIDNDTIKPFIFMAQNSEIKRLLGDDLYAKILADYEAETLAGDYDTIYTDYVAIILAYYTCSYYLKLGVPKVSQNGAYLVTPDKTEQIFSEEAYKMAEIYEKLAIGLELRLIDYLNTLTIPEWTAPDQTTAKNSFNWLRVK
jgi:hypothetical protein